MGDVADDMMDEAVSWADESEVCERGHRYLPSEWGCPECEREREYEDDDDGLPDDDELWAWPWGELNR